MMDRTTYYLILKSQALKIWKKEELIFGDNGIVSMSNISSLAEKQKHWLQETLILMVFEIKSLAATEVPFSSSMKNCSTSAASCWELKLNGVWQDWVLASGDPLKEFDASSGLLDLDFIFVFRVIDSRSWDKNDDSDGTLFQSDGKTLIVHRMAFA